MAYVSKKKKAELAAAKLKPARELIILRHKRGTGVYSKAFDSTTGEAVHSSWVNKNLKP